MITAVLGASGFVGSAVVQELEFRGHEVRPIQAPRLSTLSTTAPELAKTADSRQEERAHLAASLGGADVVINAAGLALPSSADSPELRGANALLPLLVCQAAAQAGVRRLVHLSSAAVQGQRAVLDETTDTNPFSAYSRSKALGEEVLLEASSATGSLLRAVTEGGAATPLEVIVLRATSVHGPGRQRTVSLASFARSPLASVAAPGTAPTPVTSINALAAFVVHVTDSPTRVPAVVLQPWEGATVSTVLAAAGGRNPTALPATLCRLMLRAGYAVTSLLGEHLHGSVRRVELMWFGQRQETGWAEDSGFVLEPRVLTVLEQARTIRERNQG